jgi:pre-mRNA-processing factor SLU7
MLMLTGRDDEPTQETREPEPVSSRGQDQESASGKKRTIEELKSGITEEEMESYKRSRLAADDPMANFIGKDEE